MEKTKAQKLAEILKVLITVTLVCNLVALFLVPGLAGIQGAGGWQAAWGVPEGEPVPNGPVIFLAVCWQYLFRVWREGYSAVLTLFLWACGTCTAVVLRQAGKVLDTIITGDPFQLANAKSLNRAAGCFFVVALAALVRLILQMALFGSFSPYNALFVPMFLMAGLLCLVMSALFRQAAELKEENDLTI